jgi:hypothetical protein
MTTWVAIVELTVFGGGCFAALAWNVFQGYHAPLPPKPIARPERDPLGEDIAGAIGGAFMLAVALVGLLVWLSPALILGWLVTR